jgi:hypothetical protein
VIVEVAEVRPDGLIENGREARACEYPDCSLTAVREEMVQFASGEWYCPDHGLLLAAIDLVSLYRGAGIADWESISRILGETLPEIVTKSEAPKGRRT